MMLILKENVGEIVPSKRILRADEFLSLCHSGGLIKEARDIGLTIIKSAKKEAEKIIAEANEEAKNIAAKSQETYEAGKKEGFDAGFAEGKQEIANRLMEVTAKNAQAFGHFEDAILNIVVRSLRRIIGEMDNTELVAKIVKNALQVVRNQKHAILKVNPEQAPAARQAVEELAKGNANFQLVEVVADGRLEKNACLLETEVGVIDASLEVQLEAIRKVLAKNLTA